MCKSMDVGNLEFPDDPQIQNFQISPEPRYSLGIIWKFIISRLSSRSEFPVCSLIQNFFMSTPTCVYTKVGKLQIQNFWMPS